MMDECPRCKVEQLEWQDERLGSIPLPRATLVLTRSFGSGLSRRSDEAPGEFWAVGDRGPNLKIETMIERYGATDLKPLAAQRGAKIMPRLDIGPQLARLKIVGGRVEVQQALPLVDQHRRPISGLPMPGSEHAINEPAFTLSGDRIADDASGLDSEGVVALDDGTFILSEEFGPSLVWVDGQGQVLGRYLPQGIAAPGARYPVHQTLPAIAARRQLNRGFEAIAVSTDQQSLFVAFQSPLAHPDEAAHEHARHVRVWRLGLPTMTVEAQFLYPLDPPATFRRDAARGKVERKDLKISELAALSNNVLLVLERGSETTKIYRVALTDEHRLDDAHLDPATRPSVEECSSRGDALPSVEKHLLFTSDDTPEVAADLEGMVLLSAHELLLVNDNDFGVEGARTSFWKLTFAEPLFDAAFTCPR